MSYFFHCFLPNAGHHHCEWAEKDVCQCYDTVELLLWRLLTCSNACENMDFIKAPMCASTSLLWQQCENVLADILRAQSHVIFKVLHPFKLELFLENSLNVMLVQILAQTSYASVSTSGGCTKVWIPLSNLNSCDKTLLSYELYKPLLYLHDDQMHQYKAFPKACGCLSGSQSVFNLTSHLLLCCCYFNVESSSLVNTVHVGHRAVREQLQVTAAI